MALDLRQQAALRALDYVHSGMVLGLGSGKTASYFVKMLGEKLRWGELWDIRGVPTSQATSHLARDLRIPLVTLAECPLLDLAVDGADEVDPRLNLIKGLGRALLREKIIEIHALQLVIVVDESKVVERLGRGPLPVEIAPFQFEAHLRWLNTLGCRAELWLEPDGSPAVTDNGNYLARCWFASGIPDAYALSSQLADRPGIVEHGLFLDLATQAVVAASAGVRVMERQT